ncbi:MAG TPA: hypothetical protein VE988_08980, partial [Gemmataceae bacterium]|nr:hypothetical protein [Gemmataceae bacterium]
MVPREAVEARPRSAVEILDDGWRIYFADPLLLGSLTAFFYLPAVTCLLVLLTQPLPETGSWRILLPALCALLLPLTGLSAGACQEAFHSWSEGYDASFGECLQAACQRVLYHVASQALSLVGPAALITFMVSSHLSVGNRVFGVIVFWLFTSVMALFSLTRQPSFAAGKPRFWRAFRYSFKVSGQSLDKALLLTTMRGTLLLFAVLNLHLFGIFAFWVAEHLGGFDVAYASVVCEIDNAAYTLALILLAWALLSPFSEACNYLLFVDARTRFEGLDLWNRVQDYFPVRQVGWVESSKPTVRDRWVPKTTPTLLVLGASLLTVASALATEQPLPAVTTARQEVQKIRDEVKAANPYPGGRPWMARLEAVGKRLEESAGKTGGFRWYQLALNDFPNLQQTPAVTFLDDLDTRLAMVEDSLTRPRQQPKAEAPSTDQIKSLVPPDKRNAVKKKSQKPDEQKKPDEPPPVQDDHPVQGINPAQPVGPPMVAPLALGGAANLLLIVLIGLLAAALVAGLAYVLYSYFRDRAKTPPRQAGPLTGKADDELDDPAKQDPAQLWRQADDRARAGDYLGAVRII